MGVFFSKKGEAAISSQLAATGTEERTCSHQVTEGFREQITSESAANIPQFTSVESTNIAENVAGDNDTTVDIGKNEKEQVADQSFETRGCTVSIEGLPKDCQTELASERDETTASVMESTETESSENLQLQIPAKSGVRRSHGGYYLTRQRTMSEVDAMDTVSRCWEEVENSIPPAQDGEIHRGRRHHLSKGWKVVRFFVSSTFNDFFAERDYLVKKIFPELKEFCEARRLHFIECDLRWGIPKDTNAEDTVSVCLDELDRCRTETDSQPFFLGLLGERYGWIPDENSISKEIKRRYRWVDSISITHMEIVYGALRTRSPNAAFLVRDPSVIAELPPDFVSSFCDDSALAKEHVQCLKAKLKENFPSQVFNYKCQFDGTDSSAGLEKVVLKGLEGEFASHILTFFKEAINNYRPVSEGEEETQDEMAQRAQDVFVETRGQIVIGREAELEGLLAFADGRECGEGCASVLLIMGEPGIGKSSLLAKIVSILREDPKYQCMYNFASAGIRSTNPVHVLERFTSALRTLLDFQEPELSSSEHSAVVKEYHRLLSLYGEQRPDSLLILVLDAVNQLRSGGSPLVEWVPLQCPRNVRLIISSTQDPYVDFLQATYKERLLQISLTKFGNEAGKDLVQARLLKYNKKLDVSQLNSLMASAGANNPLWLSLACEELRVHGVFETVGDKIASLPDNIDALLQLIIQRIVAEDETSKAKEALILIRCSTNGLTESALTCTIPADGESLPAIIWAKCKRKLKFLLMNTGSRGDEETLAFFHHAVGLAVGRLFLSGNDGTKRSYHLKLANYFAYRCSDVSRVALELPVHLQLADEKKRLFDFLRKDSRSVRLNKVSQQHYYQSLRCQRLHFASKDPFASLIYLCIPCSRSRGAFSPLPNPNKDLCCVCGAFVPFKRDSSLAYVCQQHKVFCAPGTGKCHLCGKVLFLKQSTPVVAPEKLYLCSMCSIGNRCAHFLI